MQKWGYILVGPGRPLVHEQRATLATFGVAMEDFGPTWEDHIAGSRRGRNAGQLSLTARNGLINSVVAGDRVFVAAPFCLGISSKDAAWFIKELQDRYVTITIGSSVSILRPGDDASDIVDKVGRAQNRTHVASSLSRRKS